ncbi:DUF2867 domain-containing protein [Nonomuraea zeae]|uniref:DUF2867 domain-containing protein n=1 Tax=Nonomuraea zeae TaxID=1642303 RepID=A0A5S4GA75_9ACTN|nr:DUF2867 domain-containing protein [Nonomuraea zeae]TMR29917.1 DUF2867 domain-containing protein [Nonomuraea zeae]
MSPGLEGSTVAAVESAVGPHNLPDSIRALSSLDGIDYADLFTLTAGADTEATPEQWARAMLGDVPNAGERLIWRGFLGLRLSQGRSPDTVAGWRISGRGDGWLRLETASWFLSANLIVQVAGERVSIATLLRYDRPVGGLVWPPLSAVHRLLVPRMLRAALAKTDRHVTRS